MALNEDSLPHCGKHLRIQRLFKTFQSNGNTVRLFDDFSLDVDAGEFVVVVGPSGCGKTTLLRLVAGLDTPDARSGTQILLDGHAIDGPGPDRGFVFQSYSSFPWLTVWQNVTFGLRYSVSDQKERKRIAYEYLELVGLVDHANHYPRDLSGGQQQRIAIARTLALKPHVLLMDEPYAALDAQNRELQQCELLRIWQQTRPTVLFVTHDITEAVFLGQRVISLGDRPVRVLSDLRPEDTLPGKSIAQGQELALIREKPEFYELATQLKRSISSPDHE